MLSKKAFSFYVLSTSFLRLFYVMGIMRPADCILCIFGEIYGENIYLQRVESSSGFAAVAQKEKRYYDGFLTYILYSSPIFRNFAG